MTISVSNTHPEAPIVTLFGKLEDGSYTAEVMNEDEVPYTPYWQNSLDQVMVYIQPDKEQLQRIVAALNEGRLSYEALQDFGGSNGGKSDFPV